MNFQLYHLKSRDDGIENGGFQGVFCQGFCFCFFFPPLFLFPMPTAPTPLLIFSFSFSSLLSGWGAIQGPC